MSTHKPSSTASPHQPTAPGPLYTFDEYTTATGRRALSVRLDFRDIARLYAEDPQQVGGYEPDWSSISGSQYIPQAIHNADQALQVMDSFQFPLELKQAATRAARDLTDAFERVAQLSTVRHLTAGRLDRRKFAALARTSAAGTFSVESVRPYRRVVPTPSALPTVAVVASAGNAEMWGDETYIPRVLTLTLSVLWACEAAGLPVYAALVQSHCRLWPGAPYREATAGYMLAAPGETISPRTYAIALHRDLWRYGLMTVQAADHAGNRRLSALENKDAGARSIGYRFPCRNGGAAAHWARQVLGADFVVIIGQVLDEAEVRLDAHLSLPEAVSQITAQVRTLKETR